MIITAIPTQWHHFALSKKKPERKMRKRERVKKEIWFIRFFFKWDFFAVLFDIVKWDHGVHVHLHIKPDGA